jgi:hypothetical protein
MNRRSFLVAVPRVVLGAACVVGAARVSMSGPADAPPFGRGGDGMNSGGGGGGGGESPPPARPEPPAPQGPEATPRRVQPLPVPAEDDRLWLQEWLDLVARPSGKAASGC